MKLYRVDFQIEVLARTEYVVAKDFDDVKDVLYRHIAKYQPTVAKKLEYLTIKFLYCVVT